MTYVLVAFVCLCVAKCVHMEVSKWHSPHGAEMITSHVQIPSKDHHLVALLSAKGSFTETFFFTLYTSKNFPMRRKKETYAVEHSVKELFHIIVLYCVVSTDHIAGR